MNFNFHLFDKIRKHTKTLNMTLQSVEPNVVLVFFQRWCPVTDTCPRLSESTQVNSCRELGGSGNSAIGSVFILFYGVRRFRNIMQNNLNFLF